MKKMDVPVSLAFPEELEVTEIEMVNEIFTIIARCTRKHPCCPLCGTPALICMFVSRKGKLKE